MRSMIQMTGGERRRMGLLGRDKMCREFSQDTVIDRYLEVLTRLGVTDSSARNGSTPNCGSPEA
jgi:molybdopterin-guanine dinucleotide biosynthesis protein A